MARINVEDGVESRPEYRRLVKLLGGDDYRAMGMLVAFWRIAQKYWGEDKLVPLDEIETWEFQPLIESRWGVVREDGVYAIGSEERFAWYRQRVNAGKHRAEGARNEQGRFIKSGKEAQRKTSEPPAADQRNSIPHQPLTLSLTLSQNTENTSLREKALVAPSTGVAISKKSKYSDETANKMRAFIAAYSNAYKAKYGGPPEGIRDKALVGKLGNWIEHISEDRAISMVQVYLQIDYRWFNEKQHDLWEFFKNLNRIGNALNTGKDPSTVDWNKVFGGAA